MSGRPEEDHDHAQWLRKALGDGRAASAAGAARPRSCGRIKDQRLHRQLRARITEFVRAWRAEGVRSALAAYVPLTFVWGEAFPV